jgi:RNA polymerase sigma factor (sigma-70 family)
MTYTINKSVTEKDLIEGCLKGDRVLQRNLFEQFSPLMLSICRRYIKERDTAEEVMVGGFTKVFDKLNQFKSEGSFEGWIRRIMVNESLTWIRKNKTMYLEVDIEEANREIDFDAAHTTLETEALLELIQELPQGYRTVFNLFAIEGYNHKEIADQLGISVNTSKSQLSRARVYLQKELAVLEKETEIKSTGNGNS